MGNLKLTEGVEAALDELSNEKSIVPMMERFDELLHQVIAQAAYLMKRQRKTGQRKTEQESQWQEDAMEELKFIDKAFTLAKKYNRLPMDSPNPKFDDDLLKEIRQRESTVGAIVQNLPDNPHGEF